MSSKICVVPTIKYVIGRPSCPEPLSQIGFFDYEQAKAEATRVGGGATVLSHSWVLAKNPRAVKNMQLAEPPPRPVKKKKVVEAAKPQPVAKGKSQKKALVAA